MASFTGLKKWVEIGNSGVFRPEMLRPMGLPEDVSALGYGLSLERCALTLALIWNTITMTIPKYIIQLIKDMFYRIYI